jgi:hypothetical protein
MRLREMDSTFRIYALTLPSWTELFLLIRCYSSKPPVPLNMALFGNRVFVETKLR